MSKQHHAEQWHPGMPLPDVTNDEYTLPGKMHTAEDIVGLKEYEIDEIKAGEQFYIPLPAFVGGDMDEQKFLIGVALKDIPRRAIKFEPYIVGLPEQMLKNNEGQISGRGHRFITNLTEGKTGSEPGNGDVRFQVLEWNDARYGKPALGRPCLIKVPGRPWNADCHGDIKQVVAVLEPDQPILGGEVKFVFREFGPGSFDYNEVTEWAYLDGKRKTENDAIDDIQPPTPPKKEIYIETAFFDRILVKLGLMRNKEKMQAKYPDCIVRYDFEDR